MRILLSRLVEENNVFAYTEVQLLCKQRGARPRPACVPSSSHLIRGRGQHIDQDLPASSGPLPSASGITAPLLGIAYITIVVLRSIFIIIEINNVKNSYGINRTANFAATGQVVTYPEAFFGGKHINSRLFWCVSPAAAGHGWPGDAVLWIPGRGHAGRPPGQRQDHRPSSAGPVRRGCGALCQEV